MKERRGKSRLSRVVLPNKEEVWTKDLPSLPPPVGNIKKFTYGGCIIAHVSVGNSLTGSWVCSDIETGFPFPNAKSVFLEIVRRYWQIYYACVDIEAARKHGVI